MPWFGPFSVQIEGNVLAYEPEMLVQAEQGEIVLDGMLRDYQIGDADLVNAMLDAGHLHLNDAVPVGSQGNGFDGAENRDEFTPPAQAVGA